MCSHGILWVPIGCYGISRGIRLIPTDLMGYRMESHGTSHRIFHGIHFLLRGPDEAAATGACFRPPWLNFRRERG